MNYKCKCGGKLIYVEEDDENGEHHYCNICNEIYPYNMKKGLVMKNEPT